jgi:pyrimidine operon attenuation protein/uracil phosphoribosyltransferase
MVDRGHRELPIAPDYTGQYVPTHSKEEIRVKVHELDDEEAVYLVNVEEVNE